MDLAEFVKARLDEDEAVAQRNVGGGPDQTGLGDTEDGPWGWPDYQTADSDEIADAEEYIGHFRPLRMLREVEAKRAILGLHYAEFIEVVNADGDERSGEWCHECDYERFPCRTFRALATVWRDHPDYDPAWSPA